MDINNNERIKKLKDIASYVRTTALETIINAHNGHIGGNMSSVELLTALYFGGIFNFDPNNPKNENRDRVLIRGHEGPLRYTIFSLLGYINQNELKGYRTLGSRLHGHEDMNETPGVDITPSGSLGMLLSYGVGSAVANKDKGINSKTIVFLGDGEEQEGNISEAARHATTLGLNNLICIIDKNKKQLSRPTIESDGHDIKKIWEGYGWHVIEIKNGHDIKEILEKYKKTKDADKPILIIANTIKGYGVKGAGDHYSGYHTYSSVFNKQDVIDSYHEMQKKIEIDNINYDYISKIALELISKPSFEVKYNKVDSKIFDISTKESSVSPQEAHEKYLLELKKRINKDSFSNIYYVTPDLYRKPEVEELGYRDFMHFIDVGIREQHAIGMCHGISVENPDARICVCFGDAFVYRAMDQINAACMGGSNMTIVGVWPGIQGAQNGKTHQTIGQSGALMSIPELKFYEPADAIDLYNIFSKIFSENKGVNYIRLSKKKINLERNKEDMHNIGAYFVHKESEKPDVLIISSGFTVENCVIAARQLKTEYNISANVINIVSPKAFDLYAPKLISNNSPILAVYNGSPKVLSHYISNAIIANNDIPRPKSFFSHGFEIGTTGSMDDLIKYYGFDVDSIKNKTLKLVRK